MKRVITVAVTCFMTAPLLTVPSASENFRECSDRSTVSVAGSGHYSCSPLLCYNVFVLWKNKSQQMALAELLPVGTGV